MNNANKQRRVIKDAIRTLTAIFIYTITLIGIYFTIKYIYDINVYDEIVQTTSVDNDCTFSKGSKKSKDRYSCTHKYTYMYNEKEYTCTRSIVYDRKPEYATNGTISISTKNPEKCSLTIKSENATIFIIVIDIVSVVSIIIFIITGKIKKKKKDNKIQLSDQIEIDLDREE